MFRFFPVRTYVIETEWSLDKASSELASCVGKRRLLGWPDTPFVGEQRSSEFQFSRVIGYGNSFLPVVDARLEHAQGGARVHVRIRPTMFSAIFLTVFTVVSVPVSLVGLVAVLTGHVAGLIALLVPLSGVGIPWLTFDREADKAICFLRELFPPRSQGMSPFR